MNLPAPLPVPTPAVPVRGVRASDAERETVATVLREAAADGRLSMPEADDRLAAAYAAVTRADLAVLTTDLPAPATADAPVRLDRAGLTPRARRRLAIHAAIVAVLAVNLVVRFVISGAPFFWPIVPITFLLGTLLLHYAFARRPTWSDVQAVGRAVT